MWRSNSNTLPNVRKLTGVQGTKKSKYRLGCSCRHRVELWCHKARSRSLKHNLVLRGVRTAPEFFFFRSRNTLAKCEEVLAHMIKSCHCSQLRIKQNKNKNNSNYTYLLTSIHSYTVDKESSTNPHPNQSTQTTRPLTFLRRADRIYF